MKFDLNIDWLNVYIYIYIYCQFSNQNNIINHSIYTVQVSGYSAMLFNILTYLYTCILCITKKNILTIQHDIRSFNKIMIFCWLVLY